MRAFGTLLVLAVLVFAFTGTSRSRQEQPSDSEYISQALSAAPASVAKGAGVTRPEKDGTVRTLRQGTNGFTCIIMGLDTMCNDANAMAFFDAVFAHRTPPDKLGISYMLGGDKGASNTDPYATGKTAENHWIVTGPHIMVVGPGSKSLGYTEAPDPDPSSPYMMWAGTPYEHAMIPMGPTK